MKAHPNAVAYMDPGDQAVVSLARIEKQTGKKLLVGGADVDPAALAAVQDGRVYTLADPEHWLKGYIAISLLANQAKDGKKMPEGWWNPGGAIITSANIDDIIARQKDNTTRTEFYQDEADKQKRVVHSLVTLGDKRAPAALMDRVVNDPAGTAVVDDLLEAAARSRAKRPPLEAVRHVIQRPEPYRGINGRQWLDHPRHVGGVPRAVDRGNRDRQGAMLEPRYHERDRRVGDVRAGVAPAAALVPLAARRGRIVVRLEANAVAAGPVARLAQHEPDRLDHLNGLGAILAPERQVGDDLHRGHRACAWLRRGGGDACGSTASDRPGDGRGHKHADPPPR